MIYSRKLLEKLLPNFKDISDEQFIDAVSSTGNELPSKDIFHHPQLNNLVIGHLISFTKHPNSDHLNVCQVQIDQSGTINTIVCGAQNLIADKNVVVALEGAQLYDGRVISYKEVRGVVSQGMLCAYSELTPYNHKNMPKHDASGIMLFDDGVIGDTHVASFLGLDDTIYEIEIPFANRNDINGVLSFCQDIAGYFKWDFSYPEPSFPSNLLNLSNEIKLDKKACNGFILAKLENITIKDSKWSMKGLLMNNGFKPLNNLLDELNYITLLTNVPTAAYDASNPIDFDVVYANDGDEFVGFDGKKYNLNKKDIVIKSGNEIISLAGILGDQKYGTNNNTTSAYIEFANFNFTNIRNTASKYSILTDSAKRNSKTVPTFSTMVAASLLQKYFPNNLVGYKLDIEENAVDHISLDVNKFNELVGHEFKKEDIHKHLTSLGFKINDDKVAHPKWRSDISSHADLVEEVVKSMKVNDIEEQPVAIDGVSENKYTEYYFVNHLWSLLNNNYFYETKSFNMTSKEDVDKFNIFDYQNNVEIISSTNTNKQVLRNNLIHSMLNIYEYNQSYKNQLLPIFEIQKIYQEGQTGIKNLTLLTPKNVILDKTNGSKIVYDVNGLVGLVNEIVLNIFNNKVSYKPIANKYLYDNECLEVIFNNKVIGYIGSIKRVLLNAYNINEDIYVATLNWDDLYKAYKPTTVATKQLSLLPLITRDLTIVDENSKLGEKVEQVKQLDFVDHVEYIDKYIKENQMSYTLRFYFKNNEGTTNDMIENYFNQVKGIVG